MNPGIIVMEPNSMANNRAKNGFLLARECMMSLSDTKESNIETMIIIAVRDGNILIKSRMPVRTASRVFLRSKKKDNPASKNVNE